jgi:hypothetical protein
LGRYPIWSVTIAGFWLQSVKTELELGLIFGTDSRIGTGIIFFKYIYSKEPELGLDSRFHLCVELESELE